MEAYRKAWAAYATQRFEEAKRWANRAIQADPQNVHSYALLGDLAYLEHRLADAKEAWVKALDLNPQLEEIRGQIAQADWELLLEMELQAVWLGPLTIRLPQSLSPEEAQALLESLSQAMGLLESYFQYRPQRPLTVLIYPQEAWGQVSDRSSFTHFPTEVKGLFDGKIRVPATPHVQGSVLWHEYAHAVVYDLSHGRAPRWLQEGLAQESEVIAGGGPLGETGLRPVPREMPPLRALLGISERPGEPVLMPVSQFYPASHLLVRYLLSARGWDRMRAFLNALGQGQSVEWALESIYGWDLTTLERHWHP